MANQITVGGTSVNIGNLQRVYETRDPAPTIHFVYNDGTQSVITGADGITATTVMPQLARAMTSFGPIVPVPVA
jgi:hypothetical protein